MDYYTGLHFLTQARKEIKIGAKLSFLKASEVRLYNVLNLNFTSVKKYYAEALFGAIKLDRKVVGDWNQITQQYLKIWKNKQKPTQSQEYIDYLCATIWQVLRKQKK